MEKIEHEGRLLAFIMSQHYNKPGISLFTMIELSQQLAYMHHPAHFREGEG